MKAFKTPKEVENHAIKVHCPLGQDDIPCLWLRCDGMRRKRFSLMTHIQDRHCHPQLMKLMAVRRVQMATTGKSEVPLPPAPPPHPGYAPNAAYHAIKRHAAEFVNPKALAMGDEKEGPVTKSIRLTSSLILKNLVIYSSLGKKRLKSYESHLSTVALSNVEASRTVSQILFEMADHNDSS
jgi:AT-rich interactive domain-containing protein 2